jgi:predicted branched-subunit amino acid permease
MKIRIFTLLLLCATVIFSVAHAFNVSPVDPSDPFIRYTGRWDHSTPTPWAYWIGSSIIANFTGTSISATLSAAIPTATTLTVMVIPLVAAQQKANYAKLMTSVAPSVAKMENADNSVCISRS